MFDVLRVSITCFSKEEVIQAFEMVDSNEWLNIFRIKPKFNEELRNATMNFKYVRDDVLQAFIGEIQIKYEIPLE